jgi:hypothetical protein
VNFLLDGDGTLLEHYRTLNRRNQAMTAILLATMFAAAAVLALGAIADSWRQFGTAAMALREQLATCSRTRELHFTLVTTEVRRASARVYRLNFRPAGQSLPLQPELRAAA